MERIYNDRDLRRAYEHLNLIKELSAQHTLNEGTRAYSNDLKRAIRKYTNRTKDRHLVKDYGIDGYVELIQLPANLSDFASAEEYFNSEERMVCIPSQYDCTGQLFTCWHKIFKRRDRFYAYHCIGVDV